MLTFPRVDRGTLKSAALEPLQFAPAERRVALVLGDPVANCRGSSAQTATGTSSPMAAAEMCEREFG
jgi:hypothetical protein